MSSGSKRMSSGSKLRRLAELIDRIEQSALNLLRVTSKDPIASEEPPSINVKARLPLLPPEAVEDVTISTTEMTSDGTLDIEFVATVNSAEIDDISTDGRSAEIQSTDNGNQRKQAQNQSTETDNQKTQVQGQSSKTPAYKNPELLKEVYESCDTFPEMRRALGVDVTAETVRLHMVEHGIHDPESGITEAQENGSHAQSQNSSGEEETTDNGEKTTPVTNGHSDQVAGTNGHDKQTTSGVNGHSDEVQTSTEKKTTEPGLETTASEMNNLEEVNLPERVTIEEIVEALKTARTIHEVEIKLGLERKEARELLKKFDMLDTVMGRLKQPAENDVTAEEIKERIQKAVS